MYEFWPSLAIGVLGGLVATFITVALRQVWIKIIDPFLEERTYKDVHIEGKWIITIEYNEQRNESLWEIERVGHSVKGTFLITKGPDEGANYIVSGTFRNLILTVLYATSDKSYLDRGAIIMKLTGNGKSFSGYAAVYLGHTNNLEIAECKGVRK